MYINLRTREGYDIAKSRIKTSVSFNFDPPPWRADLMEGLYRFIIIFQSTPPRRACDIIAWPQTLTVNFDTHPRRVQAQQESSERALRLRISVHAREGCGLRLRSNYMAPLEFRDHAREGATPLTAFVSIFYLFQSTHPRGTLSALLCSQPTFCVSSPAKRLHFDPHSCIYNGLFQSTFPAKGLDIVYLIFIFILRFPIHAPESATLHGHPGNIYAYLWWMISIHAPYEGCDLS